MDTCTTFVSFFLCLYVIITITIPQDFSYYLDLGHEFVAVIVGFIIPYSIYIDFLELVLRVSWKQHTRCLRSKELLSVLHFVLISAQLYKVGCSMLILLFSILKMNIYTGQCLVKPAPLRAFSTSVRKLSTDLISYLPFMAFFCVSNVVILN